MAKMLRGPRAPARRTNWLARVSAAHSLVTSGNTGTHFLVDVADTASEAAKYVDGTLVRIRGVICIDGNFSVSPPDDENYLVGCCITVSHDGANPGFDSAGLSRDEIIWQDLVGESSDWRINTDTAVAVNRYGYRVHHTRMPVDVKAMRRLGDRSKIAIHVHNFSGVTSPVTIAFNYMLRVLVKE